MVAEPESLHSLEPLKARVERHDYDRLLMLSDGVFAIAITLLALELRLPDHWDGSLGGLLDATGRPLVGYAFGFMLVGIFWFIHRRLFARLQQVDTPITVLNLLLLGVTGLIPYVARMIAEAGPTRALPFYLIAIAGVFAVVALMQTWATLHPQLLHPGVEHGKWRMDLFFHALSALALGALGVWAIATRRPVQANEFLTVMIVLVAIRQVTRRWQRRQMSAVSRP